MRLLLLRLLALYSAFLVDAERQDTPDIPADIRDAAAEEERVHG
jgi:hypothetical protein